MLLLLRVSFFFMRVCVCVWSETILSPICNKYHNQQHGRASVAAVQRNEEI